MNKALKSIEEIKNLRAAFLNLRNLVREEGDRLHSHLSELIIPLWKKHINQPFDGMFLVSGGILGDEWDYEKYVSLSTDTFIPDDKCFLFEKATSKTIGMPFICYRYASDYERIRQFRSTLGLKR